MPEAAKLEWPQGNPLFDVQWRAVSESLAGNGVLSASDLEVTATANALEIQVASGTAYYVASEATLGSAETHTLSSGDGTYDRWDTVYFDTSTGNSGVREGNAEANPEPPDIQSDELLLAVVYVPANATDVPDSNVLNWRAQFSNEAEEVHYDDSTGTYSVDNVESALDELQEAAQAGSYPFTLSDLDTPFPLPSITDMDTDGNDIVDTSTTIWDSNLGLVPRGSLDDKRATTGPHTSNVTTSGEEVLLVDTSGGAVTVTLASADAETGNFVTVIDIGGDAQTNAITIDTEGSETINGSSSVQIGTNYSALILSSDGTNWFTPGGASAGGGVDIEDNGSNVVISSTGIDFGTDLSATDNGDGTVTVDSDAGGVNVLSQGTFTHTGGSASSTTVSGVTTDETANLYVEVGVDSDPSFNANYAWDYSWGEAWDDTNPEKDVTIDASWDTDPGSGNDVVLDYRIYTLDISVSKSRIQDLVDSPNGNIPTALLDDTESVEISVPVPDGEELSVYRWGGYKIADGTAPSGLTVQLLDGSDTVQASENTANTENTVTPVASHSNGSGSLSIFKLRVENATGGNLTTDGVGAVFSYVVE